MANRSKMEYAQHQSPPWISSRENNHQQFSAQYIQNLRYQPPPAPGHGRNQVPGSAQGTNFRTNTNTSPGQSPNGNADGIIYEGEGVVLAGRSSDHFLEEWSLELCYQCCKRIPLEKIYETRTQRCGTNSCGRVECGGLKFIRMPPDALDTCDEFRALVVWWMDKLDCGAVEDIARRARQRVQEVRDEIPVHGRCV